MIVCPHCGFTEKFSWKNSPHQLYMQYLNPEEAQEFLKLHPDLAAALKFNRLFAKEGYYAYRMTKSGHLHRQPAAHCLPTKWTNYSNCYEKPKKRLPKSQKKLIVEAKPAQEKTI